jgi:hypothetical protein
MVLVLFAILAGVRAVGLSGKEVAQMIQPSTAGGKGPGALAKGEPAEAEILFESPVEVEEVLRIVGEENRDNLRMMEGSFRAGGEEIGDGFSVPARLETANEIERAWAMARTTSLVDMSLDGPNAQADEMKETMNDPRLREILVTKVLLEGDSLELALLPAQQSSAIKNISVITRSDIMEMFERVRKEAKRRGEPPPVFD